MLCEINDVGETFTPRPLMTRLYNYSSADLSQKHTNAASPLRYYRPHDLACMTARSPAQVASAIHELVSRPARTSRCGTIF